MEAGISAILQGSNICDILLPFLHTKALLKKGLFLKEIICFHGEQILSF